MLHFIWLVPVLLFCWWHLDWHALHVTDAPAGAGGRGKLTFCSTRADAAAAMLPHIRAEDLYASLGGKRADEVRLPHHVGHILRSKIWTGPVRQPGRPAR